MPQPLGSGDGRNATADSRGLTPSQLLALGVGFAALAFVVYGGALRAPFFADDNLFYSPSNPLTTELTTERLLEVVDPGSPFKRHAFNYAPVHLLASAAEVWLFGAGTLGYHVLNTLLHALNALLLVALLRQSGVARSGAILGGVLFLVHPANVEAVAWASQLKSLGALGFGLGALLVLWRHPAWATLLFGLALLTKFSAAAFLVMAAALVWVRGTRGVWGWLGLWAVLLGLIAIPQFAAFHYGGGLEDPRLADPWVRLRSMGAYGAQYLAMAATGIGVSAYHEPPPAQSPFDVRWLVGAGLGALLTARVLVTLRRREEEAAWWVWAAAAFVPVSQLVSFRYPMADRYLYFILPGLIGGGLLLTNDLYRRISAPLRTRLAAVGSRAVLVAGVALAVLFSLHSARRARLWDEPFSLFIDAASQYPSGSQANYVRAVVAANQGDAERAVAELRAAEEKNHPSLVTSYIVDPYLAAIRDEPIFREFILDTARYRIERARERGIVPGEEGVLALAHEALGEYDEAIALTERALRAGDPQRDQLLIMLERLQARKRGKGSGGAAP